MYVSPAKEVLSLFNIILKSRELDKAFGFDDTYYDLVKALRIAPQRGKNYTTFAKLRESLKNIIDGRVAMKEWIKTRRTLPLEQIFKTVNAKLRGHYQYYDVTDNTREVKNYLAQTKRLLYKWLNRRSQKRSYTWECFNDGLLRTFPLLEPKIKVSLFYR